MGKLRSLIFAIAAVLGAISANAGPVEEGYSAYQKGDYEAAFKNWKRAASEGDAVGQNNLGILYLEGKGVRRDLTIGLDLVRRSAEAGYSLAQYNLGLHYADGEGVPRNSGKALRLFGLAGSQGHLEALQRTGAALRDGIGVRRDYRQAYIWFALGALQGNTRAEEDRVALSKVMSAAELSDAKAILAAREKGPAICQALKDQPTSKFSSSIAMQGFNVLTPMGGGWCSRGPNFFRSGVTFEEDVVGTVVFEHSGPPARQSTLIAIAERVDVEGEIPRTPLQLLAMTRKWAALAFPTIRQLSGKTRLRFARGTTPEDRRFKGLDVSAAVEDLNGMTCVHYRARTQETDNSLIAGKLLTMNTMGFLCYLSTSDKDLLHIAVSERYPAEDRRPSRIFDPVNLEYELFLYGLFPYRM